MTLDTEKFMRMIGWYDKADGPATHDPIPNNAALMDVPSLEDVAKCHCMICEQPLLNGPIKSISMRWEVGFLRSYFYRVHTACYRGHEQAADAKAWTMIEAHAMESRVSA